MRICTNYSIRQRYNSTATLPYRTIFTLPSYRKRYPSATHANTFAKSTCILLPRIAPSPLQHPCLPNTMSLLRPQLVVVPLSLLLGFLIAYYSFKGALWQTAFGEPVHVGGGYNALGRIRPLNATEAAAVASEWGEVKGRKKNDEVVPDGMKVKDLAAAVENATLGVSMELQSLTFNSKRAITLFGVSF